MLLLDVEDAGEATLLQRQDVDLAALAVQSRRVADDVDQPVERMQASEQIVVLAVGARQERGEMAEARAFETLAAVEALEHVGILRADAIDQDLVDLADLARDHYREGQHVPERKAEIVDHHLAARVGMPFLRIERGQKIVELARAGVEIDLDREAIDQPVELGGVLLHECLGVIGKATYIIEQWPEGIK